MSDVLMFLLLVVVIISSAQNVYRNDEEKLKNDVILLKLDRMNARLDQIIEIKLFKEKNG